MKFLRYIFFIPEEDKVRYRKIFEDIDKSKSGKITFCDLCESLSLTYKRETGHPLTEKYFLEKAGQKELLNYEDFSLLMFKLEKDLHVIFMDIDKNKDGLIDANELMQFFESYKIKLSPEKVAEILKDIVKEPQGGITWELWKKYNQEKFLNTPENIVKYWNEYFEDFTILDTMKPYPVFSTLAWWKLMLAGGTAGLLSRTITAPLDRIRICYSVSQKHLKGVSLVEAFKRIIQKEGFLSLWKGNGTALMKKIPDSSLRFFLYEEFKAFYRGVPESNEKRRLAPWQTFLMASCTAAFTQTLLYPLAVVKVRLALDENRIYKGIFDCMKQIYHKEGPRGFYRGLVPSLSGHMPYSAVDISTFEILRNAMKKYDPDRNYRVLVTLSSGILSNMFSLGTFYPLFVIQTEMQAETKSARDTKVTQVAKRIYTEDGLRGFYKGIVPCVLRVAPAVSLSYVIYEQTKMFFYKA